ncbi:MAG: hypothetical protein HQL19_08200, partial [Candidatus Omnitrophica bacterium]|nr:hypothetical protein [Candidatus Omnitrophota bacterium]
LIVSLILLVPLLVITQGLFSLVIFGLIVFIIIKSVCKSWILNPHINSCCKILYGFNRGIISLGLIFVFCGGVFKALGNSKNKLGYVSDFITRGEGLMEIGLATFVAMKLINKEIVYAKYGIEEV